MTTKDDSDYVFGDFIDEGREFYYVSKYGNSLP